MHKVGNNDGIEDGGVRHISKLYIYLIYRSKMS